MFKLKAKNISYKHIAYEWLDLKREQVKDKTLKEQTYIKYYSMIERYIIPIIGNEIISNINIDIINVFFNNNKIKELSSSSKKTLLYIINSMGDYCNNKYNYHFEKFTIKIKNAKPKLVYLTKEEQKIIEELLDKKKGLKSLGIMMCLYTGLRLGELCGLRWCDIDFNNNCYYIRYTVQRVKNLDKTATTKTKLIISEPKTINSKRTVPIPDFLIPILEEYRNKDNIFVFSDKETPRDPRTFEAYFERILRRCNIRKMNFHILRHTFATRALESGMDIKTLSEILGHASYRITLDIYAHSSFDLKKDSINSLANYINKQYINEE